MPLQRQLAGRIRTAIRDGQLAPGARLPSSRALAVSLGVSRTVVVGAYEELGAEGYLEGRRGSGTYVAAELAGLTPLEDPAPPGPSSPYPAADLRAKAAIEFTVGRTDTRVLSLRLWKRMWRSVARRLPSHDDSPPEGDPHLRTAIAAYLRQARGLRCGPDDVVVTPGAMQALRLLARAVVRPGDPAAVEEPGYPVARQILRAEGASLVPVPADDDGLRVDLLPTRPPPVLVYVTPSHHYPLGGRLPVPRRMRLLQWAASHGVLIVEDDYDSELRYGGPPIPAAAGLDGAGCVAYVGTFSDVLTPVLRLGYVVAAPTLRRRILELKQQTEDHTPWPVQRAVATLIAEGDFSRHIARVRRHYAARRAALREALSGLEPMATLRGLDAGLHAFLELHPALDAEAIARQAATRGVIVHTIAPCYLARPDRQGLLLGYGGISEEDIRRGAAVIASLVREAVERVD
ncbi:MAG: PLP-dependent aminotransferase family protein [Armatimonadota bacterium]|nr:PLP-dependent aminotransferase family protein [Armatimonadota bacterium]